MIATLRGILQHTDQDRIIIDVHGVGYEVFVAENVLAQLPPEGEDIFLYIHTHVREDALHLFGFLSEADKKSYQLLLNVSGVGPKLAMAIVAAVSPAELARAVSGEDIARLTQVSGVGKKTAKRLCLELKDKVDFIPDPVGTAADESAPAMAETAITPVAQDCLSALINLGYHEDIARQAVEQVMAERGEDADFEEVLRHALQSLA